MMRTIVLGILWIAVNGPTAAAEGEPPAGNGVATVAAHVTTVEVLDASGAPQREVPATALRDQRFAVHEVAPDGLLKITLDGAPVWVDPGQFDVAGGVQAPAAGARPSTAGLQRECLSTRGMAGEGCR